MDDFGILFKWKPQTISNRKYSGSMQIFDAMGFALVSLHIIILYNCTRAYSDPGTVDFINFALLGLNIQFMALTLLRLSADYNL